VQKTLAMISKQENWTSPGEIEVLHLQNDNY